ncbi:pumilio homology domain family member 4 [Ceratobasidium sp. AG-Ba]|nr:pumilio homology domain family member 4 [Ceratobasidium sp. AG-Ba]QRW10259.1 pumilio domain-containing protein C6G9,14 [Ceratobasidium sp. AG-Ba]
MAGSRCGSGKHGDLPGINLQGLSTRDGSSTTGQTGQGGILKNGAGGFFGPTALQPSKGFNPGFLLDEELDKESPRDVHINLLPLASENHSKSLLQSDSYSRLSASSAALDLAPLSQTSPRGPCPNGRINPALRPSKWPQFSGAPLPSDAIAQPRIRNTTDPGSFVYGSMLAFLGFVPYWWPRLQH